MTGEEDRYGMRLADGQGWHFTATPETREWVKKLAGIMELETGDTGEYPEIIFARREPGFKGLICRLESKIHNDLPKTGWRSQGRKWLRFWSHRNLPDTICELGHEGARAMNYLVMWFSLFPVYQQTQHRGGISLHAALVERDGIGVLLAAPGEVGKSTCCRRIPRPWSSRCDDETMVVRVNGNGYMAHPFPTWSDYMWQDSGRTWNVQRGISLAAIFFLLQAETDEVIPLGQGQTALLINRSESCVVLRNREILDREEVMASRMRSFRNACGIAKAIPGYILRFSRSGRFWEEIEKVL
ncbi:MAG: SynChlorMet cassette protein ScmC [Deltaproteobacteria bacterium]|nr:MAG: SynChlorMet cassette protein ScmC [Deltaproteobacteria bacterium]